MRQFSTSLSNSLNSDALSMCWCWRASLTDGTVLRFTDHDSSLSVNGEVYDPANGIEVSVIEAGNDLSSDNMSVVGLIDSSALSEEDLRRGRLDGATIELFVVDWMAPQAYAKMHTGQIGEVKCKGGQFSAELLGVSRDLERNAGRILTTTCDAVLGDTRCGVDLSEARWNYSAEITAVTGTNHVEVRFTSSASAPQWGWFKHGTLILGGVSGRSRYSIADEMLIDGGRGLMLWKDIPQQTAIGDAVTLVVGCDKIYGTCAGRFANALNFRGFPHMPGNRVAVAVASQRSGSMSGESLNA